MSRDPLRLSDYLGHINEAITRILSYCKDMDEAGFLSNAMVQDAVIRNFEIIGDPQTFLQDTFLRCRQI